MKTLVLVIEMSVDPNVDIDFNQLSKELLEANESVLSAEVKYDAQLL